MANRIAFKLHYTLAEARQMSRWTRRKLRLRGATVPDLRSRGHKQSAEWVAKRIKRGHEHYRWQGDKVSTGGGHLRAERLYKSQPCEQCGRLNGHRHHKDEDTSNNDPSNIEFLCQKCHMKEHARREGRLVTVGGQSDTLYGWANRLKCSHTILCNRKRSGWTDEQTILTPINKHATRRLIAAGKRPRLLRHSAPHPD